MSNFLDKEDIVDIVEKHYILREIGVWEWITGLALTRHIVLYRDEIFEKKRNFVLFAIFRITLKSEQ